MSVANTGSDLARQLIVKIATDPVFRNKLIEAASVAEKREVIEAAGFGAIKPIDIPGAAFAAAAQVEDLDDAQMSRVATAANDTITTVTTTTTVFAGASAAVAAA